MVSSIPNGKFLTGKCSLSGTPCVFLKIGQSPYCKICRIADEHGKLNGDAGSKSVSIKSRK